MDVRSLGVPYDSKLGLILSDPGSDEILEINETAAVLLQSTPAELRGKSISSLFPVDVQHGETFAHFAKRVKMLDVAKVIDATVQGVKSARIAAWSNVGRYVSTVIWDSTQSTTTNLLDHTPHFLGMLTLQGRVLFASSAAKTLFGVAAENMHQEPITKYLHPEDRHILELCMKSFEQGDSVSSGVVRVLCEGDAVIYCSFSLKCQLDAQKMPTRLIMTAFDNTQIRTLRTEHIGKVVDSSKGHFEHVSKGLLTAEQLAFNLEKKLKLAEQQAALPELKGQIHDLQRIAHALTNSLQDVQSKSAEWDSNVNVHNVIFCLHTCLVEITRSFATIISQKALQVEQHIDPNVFTHFYADQIKIKEVLKTILLNAITYTPNGGKVEIHVSCVERNDQSQLLHFEIRDNGPVISEQAKKELFQSRISHASETGRTSGEAGLKLDRCRATLSILQGNFGVVSSERTGTTFFFTLRMRNGEQLAVAEPQLSNCIKGKFENMQISALVVDDVDSNLKIYQNLLQFLGVISIETAKNGNEAIDKATKDHFDLILMDIMMPEKNGYDAVHAIRQYEQRYDVKRSAIIFNSSDHLTLEQALHLHADGAIPKPVKANDFADAIAKVIKPPLEIK